MGLPILLNHKPTAWRTNPHVIPIRCWRDRAKTLPLDLTRFGSDWTSQIRVSYGGPLVATFVITTVTTVDPQTDDPVLNGLNLTIDGSITAVMVEPYYVFDVRCTGGSQSPLTVFLGGFAVDGEVTDA